MFGKAKNQKEMFHNEFREASAIIRNDIDRQVSPNPSAVFIDPIQKFTVLHKAFGKMLESSENFMSLHKDGRIPDKTAEEMLLELQYAQNRLIGKNIINEDWADNMPDTMRKLEKLVLENIEIS